MKGNAIHSSSTVLAEERADVIASHLIVYSPKVRDQPCRSMRSDWRRWGYDSTDMYNTSIQPSLLCTRGSRDERAEASNSRQPHPRTSRQALEPLRLRRPGRAG